jgi:ABC-type antimicrobial peptide transport system permease subunit
VQDFNEIIQEVARCFGCKVLDTSGCRLLKQYSSFSIPTPDEGEILRDRAYMIDIAFASEQGEAIIAVILMLLFFM